jgi:hypothetical protein
VGVGGISVLTLVSAVARRIAGPGGRRGLHGLAPGLVIGAHLGDGGSRGGQSLDDLRDEVEALKGEVTAMHDRLAELDDVQNRLDFAERMLAQAREKGALPPGGR